MSRLIVRLPNYLGDTCMTLPALDLLARGGFEISLAGRPWARPLFSGRSWPVFELGTPWWARVRALRQWRNGQTDARGLLFANSLSSALEMRCAGVQPMGYATDARAWLLAPAVPLPRPLAGVHMVEYYYALAARLVAQVPPLPAELALPVSPDATLRARSLLAAAGVTGPYVMLCPLAAGLHRGRMKVWNGFGRLCDRLIARGVRVVACPGPGERDAMMRAVPRAIVLPQSGVDVFAALLQQSALVVANDSGPGHLAAAVGAPLVSVFGVTEPQRTRPWGSRVTLVGSENGWPDDDEVEKAVLDRLNEAKNRI